MRGGSCAQAFHDKNKFRRGRTFWAIPVKAFARRIHHYKLFFSARVRQNEWPGSGYAVLDSIGGLEAVALRHPDVKQDQVGQPVSDCFQRITASASNTGFDTIKREIRRNTNGGPAIVVDNQDSRRTRSMRFVLVGQTISQHFVKPKSSPALVVARCDPGHALRWSHVRERKRSRFDLPLPMLACRMRAA